MFKFAFLCLVAATVTSAAVLPSRLLKQGVHNRIVGGVEVEEGQIPYIVSFQQTGIFGNFHFCAGSIWNEEWIITAAHCVAGEDFDNPRNLQIFAGQINLRQQGKEVAIIKIVQHENYNPQTVENDIALLKIATPLVWSADIQSIVLAEMKNERYDMLRVSGWGDTSEGGSSPNIMRTVEVPFVTDEVCREAYGENAITDSMICAGQEGKDSCQGDSGGPIVADDSTEDGDPTSTLVGVVSWGRGCAQYGYPGVYTQVSYFNDWVMANAV